jgi:hypothetical protein
MKYKHSRIPIKRKKKRRFFSGIFATCPKEFTQVGAMTQAIVFLDPRWSLS